MRMPFFFSSYQSHGLACYLYLLKQVSNCPLPCHPHNNHMKQKCLLAPKHTTYVLPSGPLHMLLPRLSKPILSPTWPTFHSRVTIPRVFLDSKSFPGHPVRREGDISTPHSRHPPEPRPKPVLRLPRALSRKQSLTHGQVSVHLQSQQHRLQLVILISRNRLDTNRHNILELPG